MKAVFVESSEFTAWVADYLPDETYARTQQELMDNPDKEDLYVPELKRFFLLHIYGKDEKDDLSANEKKVLAKLAEELRAQARTAAGRKRNKK